MSIVINRQHQRVQTLVHLRAFTLIEVLIAILVLAIGLLGLGAVFPAVIAEQRNAFAVIEGENTASSAEAMLSNREFLDFALLSQDFNRPMRHLSARRQFVIRTNGLCLPLAQTITTGHLLSLGMRTLRQGFGHLTPITRR